jgi:hypothetical protein
MLDFQKFFKELSMLKVSQIIAALCTVAIVSMDLGVDYTKSEQSIYQSFLFQTVAMLSVGYSLTNDLTTTVVIYILWCIFKYTKMNFKVSALDMSGDTVEEPIESFSGDEVTLNENEESEFFFGDEE